MQEYNFRSTGNSISLQSKDSYSPSADEILKRCTSIVTRQNNGNQVINTRTPFLQLYVNRFLLTQAGKWSLPSDGNNYI